MEWRDQGILIGVRKHGESSAIIDVLTQTHGRHSGIVRGGAGRKLAPLLQQGANLDLSWRARLESHLGTFTIELNKSRTADVMSDRLMLAGLNAVCTMAQAMLAERTPCTEFYKRTYQVLDILALRDIWPLAYVQWELDLLNEIGFGLDLESCAVTGGTEELIYISPKSGKAVSKTGAGPWADRLLPLPASLRRQGAGDDSDVLAALQVLSYFWDNKVAANFDQTQIPSARARFIDLFQKQMER